MTLILIPRPDKPPVAIAMAHIEGIEPSANGSAIIMRSGVIWTEIPFDRLLHEISAGRGATLIDLRTKPCAG